MELYPDWAERRGGVDWEKVSEGETPLEEPRDVDLSSIEMDLSGNR